MDYQYKFNFISIYIFFYVLYGQYILFYGIKIVEMVRLHGHFIYK